MYIIKEMKKSIAILLLLLTTSVFAQKTSVLKRIFVDAEFHLLYEEYSDALPLYYELYKSDTSNSNFSYRIGQCLIHLKNSYKESIPYLENAIDAVSLRHKEGYFTEKTAPIETYLYLGRAYRMNYELDKAYEAFMEYKYALKKKNGDIAIVNKELESINNAKQFIKNPITFLAENLGNTINTSFPNLNAVVSGDENTIIYVSKLKFYNGIFMSTKNNGVWSIPRNITAELMADGDMATVFLSLDGKTLLLSRNDNDDYNIYVSTYSKLQEKWKPIEKFDKEVNSKHWETHACLSPDGNTIFYSSNRPGGYGGFDLYYSQKNEKGEWGPSVNLGKTINSSFDEISPYILDNSAELYFSSNGHKTMGGFDVFHCYIVRDKFSDPANIGYPINTPKDDIFFVPIKNGLNAYYSLFENHDGYGEDDIYRLSFDINKSNTIAGKPLDQDYFKHIYENKTLLSKGNERKMPSIRINQ